MKRILTDMVTKLQRAMRRSDQASDGVLLPAQRQEPCIDLFYWQPRTGVNFGDELGRVVVELMLAEKGYTLFDRTRKQRQLLSVGSIIHFAHDNAVIWGSGRNGKIDDADHRFNALDVRAVRGPRTQEFLKKRGIHAPEVFGDPALLLPSLTKGRFKSTFEKKAVFVPNLNDVKNVDVRKNYSDLGVATISPMQGWNIVVRDILKYSFVMASSLHGLIIAEAFGIPARYVRLSEHENMFKYQDYYEGTGRNLDDFARSVPEALEMGGMQPLHFAPSLLMAAFPYDLWE